MASLGFVPVLYRTGGGSAKSLGGPVLYSPVLYSLSAALKSITTGRHMPGLEAQAAEKTVAVNFVTFCKAKLLERA